MEHGKPPPGRNVKAFRRFFSFLLAFSEPFGLEPFGHEPFGLELTAERGSAEGSPLSGCGQGSAGIGFAKDVQHHIFEAVYIGALFFHQSDIAQDRRMIEVF